MKVAAVIPAFNEEKTIGSVVDVVRVSGVDEVVVVSDGSTDNTAKVAAEHGAHVISLENNVGKGGAMKAGYSLTGADVILFLDGDLIGLKEEHVQALLHPVVSGQAHMTVGRFVGGRVTTDLAQTLTPFLSGQRAVSRYLLDRLSDLEVSRFGVEMALTKIAKKVGAVVKEVELHDLSHVMKEEKMGFTKGLRARAQMYWDIMATMFKA